MPKRKAKRSTQRKQSVNEKKWPELPEDILHLFSKKLPDISDFIRFRAVCKRWQLSALVNDPPPQLPWLQEIRYRDKSIIRFYCLSSGKVHTITCPASCRTCLEGPACRYLLAYQMGNSERYLLNPLTCDQIRVPFINAVWFQPDYIGPDPIEGGDIVVISAMTIGSDNSNTPPNLMGFWRPEADDWVYVKVIGNSANAFYMGQYFSNDRRTGITNVFDIATTKLAYQVAPPEGTKDCTVMVESGGRILRLFQYYEGEQCHFDIQFLYFRDGEAKPRWVKITDIGDQILFLQDDHGLSFSANNFVGFKGNCIYFLKEEQYLCRYDIGDGTTEVLPCPFVSLGNWFVPCIV